MKIKYIPKTTKRIQKVLLLLETSREYGRGLLGGIAKYASVHANWIIERQAPFYLQHHSKNVSKDVLNTRNFQHIDGIIMREQKNINPILKLHIPVIFASFLKQSIPGCTQLSTDDEKIGHLGAEHFLQRGFRHFAYIGYKGMFWSQNRRDSFADRLKHAGYAANVFPDSNKKSENNALIQWLLSLAKPVGLMACNDDRALDVLEACQQAGLKIPEEVAILGVDNDKLVCTLSHPPLSSVALDLETAGFKAAALLDRMMQGKTIKSQIIPVTAHYIVTRQSTDVLSIEDAVVVEAISFIRDNIHRSFGISDVLCHLSVSHRGLYDKFQKTLGCSIYRYIKHMRIQRIEQLLSTTDMPIAKIALEMGFPSPDHISSYFRSEKGCTPLEYRKNHS